MIVEATWRSGPCASTLTRYLPLPATTMRNPGVEPDVLPLSMTHEPSGTEVSSSLSFGQALIRSSSRLTGLTPSRFVNQAESGTSSRLFTFTDSPDVTSPTDSERGRSTICSAPSQ